jgi:hypothetical protein
MIPAAMIKVLFDVVGQEQPPRRRTRRSRARSAGAPRTPSRSSRSGGTP